MKSEHESVSSSEEIGPRSYRFVTASHGYPGRTGSRRRSRGARNGKGYLISPTLSSPSSPTPSADFLYAPLMPPITTADEQQDRPSPTSVPKERRFKLSRYALHRDPSRSRSRPRPEHVIGVGELALHTHEELTLRPLVLSSRRRIKCDEGHPCQSCLGANAACTFEEPGKRTHPHKSK